MNLKRLKKKKNRIREVCKDKVKDLGIQSNDEFGAHRVCVQTAM